jgi:hypothetical protein
MTRRRAAEKIARTGIERRDDMMYFIKNGDVWAMRRKMPGEPRGRAELIAEAGVEMDYARYLYFVDGDGDVARMDRGVPPPRKPKKKVAKKKKKKVANKKKKVAKKKKAAKKKTPPRTAARERLL